MEPLPDSRIDGIPVLHPKPEHLVSEAMKKPPVFTAQVAIKQPVPAVKHG